DGRAGAERRSRIRIIAGREHVGGVLLARTDGRAARARNDATKAAPPRARALIEGRRLEISPPVGRGARIYVEHEPTRGPGVAGHVFARGEPHTHLAGAPVGPEIVRDQSYGFGGNSRIRDAPRVGVDHRGTAAEITIDNRRQRAARIEDEIEHVAALAVGPLHAVYEGASLHGHATLGLLHAPVGDDSPDLDRELDLAGVTVPPHAIECDVAPPLRGSGHLLAIDGYRRLRRDGVDVGVQRARNRYVPRPAWDTQLDAGAHGLVRRHRERRLPAPRHLALDGE